jgi:HAD superfamily hydrolase (TIGR01450 family)
MRKPPTLSSYNTRLTDVDTFILDLDGTVYLSDRLIEGALDFLTFLRETGRRFVFITNNSSRTAEEYIERLGRLGIECPPEAVYTSLDATLAWLAGQSGRRVMPLGVPSFVEKVRAAGYEIVRDEPDWVLLGFDQTIDYDKIRAAARALLAGAGYVATHPDLVCPTVDGPIPDTGSFIKMFEAATGRTPVICGKPYPAMIQGALSRLGGSTERAAIIGDRLYTDMAMGRAAGILAVLVLSGETKAADVKKAAGEHRPHLVFDNLAAVLAEMQA